MPCHLPIYCMYIELEVVHRPLNYLSIFLSSDCNLPIHPYAAKATNLCSTHRSITQIYTLYYMQQQQQCEYGECVSQLIGSSPGQNTTRLFMSFGSISRSVWNAEASSS